MSRKLFGMMLGLGVLASVVLSAPAAHATYNAYLYQDGNNVVASGSGTINLTDLTNMPGKIEFASGLNASVAELSTGVSNVWEAPFTGFNGPTKFGPGINGNLFMPASSSSGNAVSIVGNGSYGPIVLGVYEGYASGAFFSSSAVWDLTTLSGLGVTTGTYSWTWGTGANADSFNLFIGTNPNSSPSPSATPEPSTWVLFGTGILAMMGWTYRRQKALQS